MSTEQMTDMQNSGSPNSNAHNNNAQKHGAFNKILIANRGEIALRVIRTARQMGYRTVAVYSEADRDAPHVLAADQAVCVGPAGVAESYLVIDNIITAAKKTQADAIHPGYGFLSENPAFARACEETGIRFIGPHASAIELMGSKRLSKVAMLQAGVPCIPGYQGEIQTDEVLIEKAHEVGFPIMVKASAGGGGRGMRLVKDQSELAAQIKTARSEAQNAFGNGELILERAVLAPRHIEIQIFADSAGNTIYLGERDCSIQRRHQKVVEEAPSLFVDEALRKRMGKAAVSAAKACHYEGAGTVEFLVDKDKNFYFLEMNTRLQVEHPVTELVIGQDLVEWQLRVAAGEVLPLTQDDVSLNGHAIEVRLYAEDPRQNFMPQTGNILLWQYPDREGIRVDHGIHTGDTVSAHYDPMLAKVIAHGPDRETAARRLASAIEDVQLVGVNTNKRFLLSVLRHPAFIGGQATTAFIEQYFTAHESTQEKALSLGTLARAALIYYQHPLMNQHAWGSAAKQTYHFNFKINELAYAVQINKQGQGYVIVCEQGKTELTLISNTANRCVVIENDIRHAFYYALHRQVLFLDDGSGHYQIENITQQPAKAGENGASTEVNAVMDGMIVDVLVEEGDTVEAGQIIVVMEAMKMEHQLKTKAKGRVEHVRTAVGQQVKSKQQLVTISRNDKAQSDA
ncbi:acetyl/propionyl/methylcrotonyl-CoA carboxylase subunit alpha [Paraglaciecola polaris]|uniref:Biotin carboxylase n=1 Tax=Paraglaciecola polaris LMG 21857 TaxID=1129793 RepID=K6ZXK8_9ALTE|nr:acetyl/propionyl/methylcrotonyl-CoA carboxylase subunit alpha [Paraglaciecola polaris]GAC34957.1 geranyl-CoA carboxylase alpha subunit [Paraglaciecola polaris LMG 21857]